MTLAWRDREGWLNIMFLGDGRVEVKNNRVERRWEIIMRNWDWREFRVQVNLPIQILQVLLRIWRVITLMQGLQTPIGQVIPLSSHIGSYPPYQINLNPPFLILVHNSTIITEHKVKSSISISACHDHKLMPSTAYSEYCSVHPRLCVFRSFWRLGANPKM